MKKSAFSSWGFCVSSKHSGDTDSILHTACGPVVLKKKSRFFIGAEHFSSGVGETSGVVEALLYLLSVAEATRKANRHSHLLPNLQIGGSVVFAVDATYIVNILLGRMVARENIEIIRLMTHLWRQAKLYYKMNIVWVKGHSGHAGNDLADHLAVSAGMADGKERWWVRIFQLNDWGRRNMLNYVLRIFQLATCRVLISAVREIQAQKLALSILIWSTLRTIPCLLPMRLHYSRITPTNE